MLIALKQHQYVQQYLYLLRQQLFSFNHQTVPQMMACSMQIVCVQVSERGIFFYIQTPTNSALSLPNRSNKHGSAFLATPKTSAPIPPAHPNTPD
ncbi:MAG: hypothetical protein V7L01_01820 [Nostoc sp.]|uniref:hypothetical protein n=1 Tax=Nostoc sp. TaxID=1180 RepID=UPI002FF4E6CC